MSETSKQCTRSISDLRIRIKICILGLSRDLFHIMRNISTVFGMKHRGNGFTCIIYVQLIIIYLRISTELFFCGSCMIEYELRGEGRDRRVCN